jgi:long-chain acyl-CoA synthetase
MNVVAQLLSRGGRDSVAVIAGPREVTYGELRELVGRCASALLAAGAGRQERIGIWSDNSIFSVAGYLAAIGMGLVAVPLQADAPPDAIRATLEDAGVRRLLVSTKYRGRADGWAREAGLIVLSEAETIDASGPGTAAWVDVDPDRDLAALMFTSGSTGRPKGVMVTHANIACNTADIVGYLGLSAADRVLVVLPFYYCFGLSLLHTHLAAGASLVLNNQFLYMERALRELDDRACTGLAGVPSTFQILLRRSRFAHSAFPSLRWIQQAGGRLPESCARELIAAFPDVRLYMMYGQTEGTARLSYLPPDRLADKLGSIGKGLPSTRLDVLRPDGTPVAAGSDEVGEIVASGRNVTRGYWNDPDETARYFRDGRLRTGDLARVDADGFIFLVDRERDMIKCGGHRVAAAEIESVIAQLPRVVEAAVVGAPHEVLGEAIVAFVSTTGEDADGAPDVLGHCRRRLPLAKMPTAVVHVRELPHNGRGKIVKSALRAAAARIVAPAEGEPAAADSPLVVLDVERRPDA